jgi:hypothetical protein
MEKFSTSDMGLAAYCMIRGMSLQTARRSSSKYFFEFKEPVEVGRALQIDWANSESSKFDRAMKHLKSLLWPSKEEGGN